MSDREIMKRSQHLPAVLIVLRFLITLSECLSLGDDAGKRDPHVNNPAKGFPSGDRVSFPFQSCMPVVSNESSISRACLLGLFFTALLWVLWLHFDWRFVGAQRVAQCVRRRRLGTGPLAVSVDPNAQPGNAYPDSILPAIVLGCWGGRLRSISSDGIASISSPSTSPSAA